MARLLLIVPRDRVTEYESLVSSFANVADSAVIVDRRVAERRRVQLVPPSGERRRAQRRCGRLDIPGTVVLFVH